MLSCSSYSLSVPSWRLLDQKLISKNPVLLYILVELPLKTTTKTLQNWTLGYKILNKTTNPLFHKSLPRKAPLRHTLYQRFSDTTAARVFRPTAQILLFNPTGSQDRTIIRSTNLTTQAASPSLSPVLSSTYHP
jgi:hypothetical protein